MSDRIKDPETAEMHAKIEEMFMILGQRAYDRGYGLRGLCHGETIAWRASFGSLGMTR